MLTGRGLGHTGGTADKLETIPGLNLGMDKETCLRALERTGLAIGMATAAIAPADRRLYALRDRTATISSLPLITASILSKKLATGAGALVFDVKTGSGAFLPQEEQARKLAELLVEIAVAMGRRCSALITDMSQPLGCWVGHAAEVREALDCLEGGGPEDLMEVTYALSEELSELTGERLSRETLREAIDSGKARELFDDWAILFGADRSWLKNPDLPLAPIEVVLKASGEGFLAAVETRRLGELLTSAGGGRLQPEGPIDFGVSLCSVAKLGDAIEKGQELARLRLRRRDPKLEAAFLDCFEISPERQDPPALIRGKG
jgi:pyrimidine-nucleoside phosphorylase